MKSDGELRSEIAAALEQAEAATDHPDVDRLIAYRSGKTHLDN